jgi:hypothetical protein
MELAATCVHLLSLMYPLKLTCFCVKCAPLQARQLQGKPGTQLLHAEASATKWVQVALLPLINRLLQHLT